VCWAVESVDQLVELTVHWLAASWAVKMAAATVATAVAQLAGHLVVCLVCKMERMRVAHSAAGMVAVKAGAKAVRLAGWLVAR
jgi:hypothetical protein